MTLLVTEIHNHNDPTHAAIVFGADRRISAGGKYHGSQKKLFEIARLKAGIGYFGLAEVNGRPMAEWLPSHLRQDRSPDLASFSHNLADRLNKVIPGQHKQNERSGFHIAGFTLKGQPEFWFVRNISDAGQVTGLYEAREDFQRRDASELPPGHAQIYRNGDIQPHAQLWNVLDESLIPLLNRPDFRRIRSGQDYAKWVRFKLEVIAYIYKQWCTQSIIGRPVDIIYITPSKVSID